MRPAVGDTLKKGAWTAEEDTLLKNYIMKFGEGKWHLVPLKAGLNRCRKSCRLRWLNYLRPDIKRGDFEEDEVDLIIRLHKLLGNRWSLIAGRIPGRTANDIKNYWNTHVRSRGKQEKEELKDHGEQSQPTMIQVHKPKPRTINMYPQVKPHDMAGNLIASSNDGFNISPRLVSSTMVSDVNINEYLDELFEHHDEKEMNKEIEWPLRDNKGLDVMELEDGQISLFDFPISDETIWGHFDYNS